jgi:pyruvate formate lyase activating enzyme
VCVTGALKKIGTAYTVDEVMTQLLKDKPYYETSGGGVTFSGGEPSLHADFILEVAKECKKHGIHTNIETNGYFNWEKFKQLLPYLDQIYFDLKIIDQKRNRDLLGGNSQRILVNMDMLLAYDAPVEFRIPLIPGHTTDNENLQSMVRMLKEKGVKKVHLLPYHSMGEAKAERICSPLIKLDQKPFDTEQLNELRAHFEREHIETELYR